MNKQEVGEALKAELEKGYDIVRISRWAFKLSSENLQELNPLIYEILEKIAVQKKQN